mgnify:FL=1
MIWKALAGKYRWFLNLTFLESRTFLPSFEYCGSCSKKEGKLSRIKRSDLILIYDKQASVLWFTLNGTNLLYKFKVPTALGYAVAEHYE